MGQSITLLKKEFLELSLEIDRFIGIELSTGFGSEPRAWTGTHIPVTIEELGQIIKSLQDIKAELDKSWVCEVCGQIKPFGTSCDH